MGPDPDYRSPLWRDSAFFSDPDPDQDQESKIWEKTDPVSNEISDLCEISDLLLFLSYFASQNKEIKPGNYFFDVCCVN